MLLGKLGDSRKRQASPNGNTARAQRGVQAIAAANAYRRAGDLIRAAQIFNDAARLDPKDVTALLEVGDIHLEAGRFARALEAYGEALQREPEHPWAAPSASYCRYRRHRTDGVVGPNSSGLPASPSTNAASSLSSHR